MAAPNLIYESARFTQEELDWLKEATEITSLLRSPGWPKLKGHMDALVGEAENDMKAHTFDDPAKSMRVQMRWQQRGMMRDTVILWVENMEFLRKELLARSKEEQ